MDKNININNIDNMSENEIDPRLRFDAFMGGVEDGGLRSVSSINLTVCYIVENIDGRVTAQNIIQALSESGIANYFEVTNAIDNLKKSNTLLEDEHGVLRLNKNTGANIELVEKDLPYTIRERSIKLVQRIIAREEYKRENKAEIVKTDEGYNIVLVIKDGKTELLSLTLFAASIEQAEMIKEKFITNPAKVYESVINGLFKE